MNDKEDKTPPPIPEQFESYDAAAAFWDAHDTTDYLEFLTPVEVTVELRSRHFEIALEEDVVQGLRRRAHKLGTTVGHLANDLLRQQLLPSP